MRHTFDAGELGRSWLAVTMACGKDKARPQLNRTVQIEMYDEGMRLTATDSFVLLQAWVPIIDAEGGPPDDAVQPLATTVAMDLDGRGRNLAGYMLSLDGRRNEDDPPLEVTFTAGVVDSGNAGQLDGLSAKYVVIEMPDLETVQLQVYEGDFVPWRHLTQNFGAKRTPAVALSTEILSRLGKFSSLYPGRALAWEFGGEEKLARLSLRDTYITGLVMPVKVQEQIAADAEPPTPDPADEDEE